MISFHSDGKFVKLVKMTCSYQDSIKRHRPEDFDKAKFECSKRENCTAVRKNPCSFSSSPSYDFCEGVPKSLSESSTVGLGVPCIYKKVGPDGTYTYVIEIMNMIIISPSWLLFIDAEFYASIFSACSRPATFSYPAVAYVQHKRECSLLG